MKNHPNMQTIAAALNVDCEQSVHDAAMGRLREDVMSESGERKIVAGPWVWRKPYAEATFNELVAVGDYGDYPNGDKVYPLIISDGSACGEYGADVDPDDPEAKLLAAAPALYAALEKMIDSHGTHGPCEQNDCSTCDKAYGESIAALRLADKGVE